MAGRWKVPPARWVNRGGRSPSTARGISISQDRPASRAPSLLRTAAFSWMRREAPMTASSGANIATRMAESALVQTIQSPVRGKTVASHADPVVIRDVGFDRYLLVLNGLGHVVHLQAQPYHSLRYLQLKDTIRVDVRHMAPVDVYQCIPCGAKHATVSDYPDGTLFRPLHKQRGIENSGRLCPRGGGDICRRRRASGNNGQQQGRPERPLPPLHLRLGVRTLRSSTTTIQSGSPP